MFENQIATLTTILKDKDIHNYMGDTFWNIIKAVSLGDIGALLDSSIDIKNMLSMHHQFCFGTKCRDICSVHLGIMLNK